MMVTADSTTDSTTDNTTLRDCVDSLARFVRP